MSNPPASTGITDGLRKIIADRDKKIVRMEGRNEYLVQEIDRLTKLLGTEAPPAKLRRLELKIQEQAMSIRHYERRLRLAPAVLQ